MRNFLKLTFSAFLGMSLSAVWVFSNLVRISNEFPIKLLIVGFFAILFLVILKYYTKTTLLFDLIFVFIFVGTFFIGVVIFGIFLGMSGMR